MNELIKITENDKGTKLVSARELYNFLEIKTDFSEWCRRMFEYGFEQEKDFTPILGKSTGGRPSIDYAMTLDTSKEISMLQRSEKGKEARQYFIACERKLKNVFQLPTTFSEALKLAAQQAEEIENKNKELHQVNEVLKIQAPKVVFADSVIGSSNSILIRQFAKDLCDSGFEIGQNRVFDWFRDKKYLNPQNEPYQNFIAMGLFEVITRAVGSGTDTFTTKTTKITGKGSVYFAEKIKNNNNEKQSA